MEKESLKNLVNPGALMRPAPFWSWNDQLDEDELRRQIREMAAKGWGSYFMHSRVGLVTGYLSDEWMNLINACVDEAEKTGTYAWLYDEDKWPSGFAGGLVPEKDEAFRSRGLVLVKKGETTETDTVLTSVEYDGLEYDICRRVQPLGNKWFNGASFVDLMSPDAVREFIDCTHEKYKEACGSSFGKVIPGIFTDEPCYIFRLDYKVPALPWSDFLPEFFKKRNGYDVIDNLTKLFFDIDDYRKVRFDYYDAATALFKESFTKQYYDWCIANNLIMTGHFVCEDTLRLQTEWIGDAMTHYEYMHWPGIDKLSRSVRPGADGQDQIVTVKQLTSAADQLNKERAFCEVYGCVGGQVSFFHRKWIGDWQAVLGVNFVNHHLSLYSMRGERKRDYPANLFYQQPWWEDERGSADYQARVCAAVTEGKRAVDLLLFQPLTSMWCEYSPLHDANLYTTESSFDFNFAKTSHRLMDEKLDFHYGNENLMAKHASVTGDRLAVGQHSYKAVLVPYSINMKSSTVELFKKFAAAGGKLIFITQFPEYVDGVKTDPEFPGSVLVRTLNDAVEAFDAIFPKRIKIIDKLTGKNAEPVFVHSREVGGSVRHFIAHTEERREVRARVCLPNTEGKDAAVFDLYSGGLYKLRTDNGTFDVDLAPAGSLLVIVGDEARDAEEELPAVLGSGAYFRNFSLEAPSVVVNELDCTPMEENVLLLNEFVLEMDGIEVHSGPVCGAWHEYFYPAADGTPFKATYEFHSSCEVEGCFAAIEVAENLDSVTFNGVKLNSSKKRGELGAFDPEKNWKDPNFTKVALPKIKTGKNVLIIEGRKVNNITGPGFHVSVPGWKEYDSTEAEEVYICGRFCTEHIAEGLYGIAPYRKPEGKDLNREGYAFYCGRMKYRADFNFAPSGKKTFLQLNGASMASARVKVNGADCGTLRWKPFVLDITSIVRSGKNEIEIDMATTLVNAFGPNRNSTIKERTGVGPGEFVNFRVYTNAYQLFDFGLESVGIHEVG